MADGDERDDRPGLFDVFMNDRGDVGGEEDDDDDEEGSDFKLEDRSDQEMDSEDSSDDENDITIVYQ